MTYRGCIMRCLPGDRIQPDSETFFEPGFQLVVNRVGVAVGSGFVGQRIPELEVITALSMQLVSNSVKHDLSALLDHVAHGFDDVGLVREIEFDAPGGVAKNWYERYLERYSTGVQKIGYSPEVLRVTIGAYIFDADESPPLLRVLLSKDVVQE